MGYLVILAAAFIGCALADPRVISYQDLMETADRFAEPGVTSYSQILFDISRNQLLVAARDSLFRLSVRTLEKIEKAVWLAPGDKVQLCQDKGQTPGDCHNFIKVLLTNGKRLFTCGTNAFSPQCSWRELEDISRVTEWVRGVGKCPYSPHSNATSLMSEETGHYFAGSTMDFSGADSAIIRDPGPSQSSYLRTNQYNSKWLNEPQFVGSFETEHHVYFLFRESAVEYINCGKIIYSRIGRVCKNDAGGQLMLRDNWTTFVKARLNCSLPGEYPFYFDNIQGMTYLPELGIVYATFTTPGNSIPGSAICSFNMTAIEASFNGAYKHQATAGSAWERESKVHPKHSRCDNSAPAALLDSSRYQLMDSAVQPTSQRPLYDSRLETLTHIAVDVTTTKHFKGVHMLYVATLEGTIKKISVIPNTHETCVLEIWKPFPHNTIQKIHFLKFAAGSVYMGTEEGLTRVTGQHCSRHKSRPSCMAAMDPQCGWDERADACRPPPDDGPRSAHWLQNATACPVFDHPVDGGWSAWSGWTACQHAHFGAVETSDQCLCSTRTCDNPPPSNGGIPCVGISVRVANCTVHGGWTPWSSWSACSQTCGMAVKTRRRVCGNPAPQHGGRVCVGQDRHEMYCHSNPPCPAVTPPVRDGGWGAWGSWGECSSRCGGGYRVRTRACNNPTPLGGLECQGCHIDYQVCNTAQCVESKRLSPWTPWIGSGNGTERRFRFTCRAPSPDPALIKVSLFKTEDRSCSFDGTCTRSGASDGDDVWSEWSAWSPCSAECGEGHQYRVRTCEARPEDCHGPAKVSRMCNTHKCKGEWGCWADWSSCSVSCGVGVRQRTRVCLTVGNNDLETSGCEGTAISQQQCHNPSCESLLGWDGWSAWSGCDGSQVEHRTRLCTAVSPGPGICQGSDRETRPCPEISNEAAVYQENTEGVTVATVAGYSLLAFVLGVGLTVTLWVYHSRRQRPLVPGSPHYISSKQNPYVTVPLKEVHSPKRTPSFARQAPPRLFKAPSDYDSSTVKRNSHSNGHLRTDLEQDKFF